MTARQTLKAKLDTLKKHNTIKRLSKVKIELWKLKHGVK